MSGCGAEAEQKEPQQHGKDKSLDEAVHAKSDEPQIVEAIAQSNLQNAASSFAFADIGRIWPEEFLP